MKTIFYNILFVSVLCFGFSVHAQNQDSEWVTCVSAKKGGCVALKTKWIVLMFYNYDTMWIYYNYGDNQYVVGCGYTHWHNGMHCPDQTWR